MCGGKPARLHSPAGRLVCAAVLYSDAARAADRIAVSVFVNASHVGNVQILDRQLRRDAAFNQIVSVELLCQIRDNFTGGIQNHMLFRFSAGDESERVLVIICYDSPLVMEISPQEFICDKPEEIGYRHAIVQFIIDCLADITRANIPFAD
ncbi:MAG: hypothetical protein IKE30_03180 [Clostridia bacterium]|nr:hypothetical protein [Clostridia bacterium]